MVRSARWIPNLPIRCGVGAVALAFVLACGGGEESAPADATPAEPAAEAPAGAPASDGGEAAMARAQEIFANRCATCHGTQGAGDGPGSQSLNPKPRDFGDPEWQASVTDEHLEKIIQYGGAAVGLSPTMPGNPDLTSRPEVVDALVRHIRSLGGA